MTEEFTNTGLKKHYKNPLITRAFKPNSWLATIDFMKMLMEKEHLLLVLLTKAKGGKSTFIDLLSNKLTPRIKTILFELPKAETELEVLQTLYASFDLPFNSKASKPHKFSALFASMPTNNKPTLIVIDNAHYLSYACLKNLVSAYKQFGQEKHIKLCLSADFSLCDNLTTLIEDGFAEFIHTLEPGNLTEAEAKTFLLRYAESHKGLNMLLKSERFKEFYGATSGDIALMLRELKLLNKAPIKKSKRALKSYTYALWILVTSFFACIIIGSFKTINELTTFATYNKTYLSYIAPFYFKAKINSLAIPPLQKLAQEAIEEPQFDSRLAIIDKVLVIPDVKRTAQKKELRS
ncbi:MAG: hypothetical protein A3F18_01200 [Legionellales bacterium RIFCSPHIGHO2_12_FULL_37_14]|nr:MAG: hypothetical protein A3F18_01200 [Legionellales bacterium RIFCSPHIGHO2_12_FULL_37_14]